MHSSKLEAAMCMRLFAAAAAKLARIGAAPHPEPPPLGDKE